MYDAINKGVVQAQGEIMGYLNCDEQYLPGALLAAKECFDRHPEMDLLYGDMLVTNPEGVLLAFRKSSPLRWPYVAASHLYIPSCTLFWRRRIVEAGFVFNSRWRMQGDADFIVRVLRAGFKARRLRRYLATFIVSSTNLGATSEALAEMRLARRGAPWWIRHFRWMWNAARLAEKGVSGAYFQPCPLEYEVYTRARLDQRQNFVARRASSRWPYPGS